jgi:hypothetical protein
MIPDNNEYYSGMGKCTIKNGIKIIQGEVNCIKPNNINHVRFLYYNSLNFITPTNNMHLSYNADMNNSSKIAIKCEWNNIYAAFGTAGNRYNFTCVAI